MAYRPRDAKPYALHEADIALFIDCAKCFFQLHREDRPRPVRPSSQVQLPPAEVLRLNFERRAAEAKARQSEYREIRFRDPWTNLDISAPVSAVWVNAQDELVLVGYRMQTPESAADGGMPLQLRRQIDISLWVLRQQEIKVSNQAYWIFGEVLVPYKAKDGWVRAMLASVKDCLEADRKPQPSAHCEFCHSSSSPARAESD